MQMEAIAEEPKVDDEPTVADPVEPEGPMPSHIREHYDAIREKEHEVRRLEGIYLRLKEESAAAKKDFEFADKSLRDMIAYGPDRQKKLPLADAELPNELPRPKRIKLLADVSEGAQAGQEFDAIVDENCEVSIAVDGLAEPICLEAEEFEVIEWSKPAVAESVEDDAWRKAPLAELGLTLKQNELFEGVGVKTIGDMEDLRARIADGSGNAQWPKGIGPAKVTDIENRIVDWLDKNRDKFGEPAGEKLDMADVQNFNER